MTNLKKLATNPNTGVSPTVSKAQAPINWPPLVIPQTPAKFGEKGLSEGQHAAITAWHESLKNTIQQQFDAVNSAMQAQTAQITALQNKKS